MTQQQLFNYMAESYNGGYEWSIKALHIYTNMLWCYKANCPNYMHQINLPSPAKLQTMYYWWDVVLLRRMKDWVDYIWVAKSIPFKIFDFLNILIEFIQII